MPTRIAALFDVTLVTEPRKDGTTHLFTLQKSKTRVKESALPKTVRFLPDEGLYVRGRQYWTDYGEIPAPVVDTITTTSRTATLVFDWLCEGFCFVRVWQGAGELPPLRVFPGGRSATGDTRKSQYRAMYKGLAPSTDFQFQIVGHWRDETVPTFKFPRTTAAALAPSLALASIEEDSATIYVDTEHDDLGILDIAITREGASRAPPGCYLPPGLVEVSDAGERDLAVGIQLFGKRVRLSNLVPGAEYGVVLQGLLGTLRLCTDMLRMTCPAKRISLMALLGLDFGDWHAMELSALKRRWADWLRSNHPDKNNGRGAPIQHVHQVLEAGGAAVEKLRAGKRLEYTDFLTEQEAPPPCRLDVSEGVGIFKDASGEVTRLVSPKGTFRSLREEAEKTLKAPVALFVDAVPVKPSCEDLPLRQATARAVPRAAAQRVSAPPDKSWDKFRQEAAAEAAAWCSPTAPAAPEAPTPPPAAAITITLGNAGTGFLHLLVHNTVCGVAYAFGFGQEGRPCDYQFLQGGPPGAAILVHLDSLAASTDYRATLQLATEGVGVGAALASASFRTLAEKGTPSAQPEEDTDVDVDTEVVQEQPQKKKKRQWASKIVSTTRLLTEDELMPADAVEVREDAVCLKVPPGWEMSLEIMMNDIWTPWCTRTAGVHLQPARLPFGLRKWRLTGRRLQAVKVV